MKQGLWEVTKEACKVMGEERGWKGEKAGTKQAGGKRKRRRT